MEQTIATLTIKLDNTSAGSGLEVIDVTKNEYVLHLNPEFDTKNVLPQVQPKDARVFFQSTLAHELGHFIAFLSRDPSHNPANVYLWGQEQREKKAWDLAHETAPNIDPLLEAKALKRYRVNDQFGITPKLDEDYGV